MIRTSHESKRGCGYRKPGGLYLVSGALAMPCGKLPIPLTVCPCCGAGIKPARGWTWVSRDLVKDAPCHVTECQQGQLKCRPWNDPGIDKYGLIWVGEKFYPQVSDFMRESKGMGISRRISAVPKDFYVGTTWVLLAHRKAIYAGEEFIPGIFQAFKPEAIEYIITGDETQEELERMEKRGISLVDVVKIDEPLILEI